jgi:NTE family protein
MQIGRLAFVLIATFLLQACSHAPLAYRVPVPAIMPAAAPLPNINVALALSGGGARGAAHIGVISALDHHGIPIDLVVGSSIGAVVGALYAEHGDISKVHRKVHKITKWDLFDPSIKNMIGFITAKAGAGGGQRFIHRLESLLTVDYFEQLRIPFIAVSSDLKHNKAAAIRSGPLVPAIYASAAIPLIFSSVPLYGMQLVDGGITDPVPVRFAKEHHPKLTIAVNISVLADPGDLTNSWFAAYSSLYLNYYTMSQLCMSDADIIIHPHLVGVGMFDDDSFELLYRRGYVEAEKAIPAIKAKMQALGISTKGIHAR